MGKQKWYFGNNPNSREYDPNLPPGWNRWDAEEIYDGNDIRDDDWEDMPCEEKSNEEPEKHNQQ